MVPKLVHADPAGPVPSPQRRHATLRGIIERRKYIRVILAAVAALNLLRYFAGLSIAHWPQVLVHVISIIWLYDAGVAVANVVRASFAFRHVPFHKRARIVLRGIKRSYLHPQTPHQAMHESLLEARNQHLRKQVRDRINNAPVHTRILAQQLVLADHTEEAFAMLTASPRELREAKRFEDQLLMRAGAACCRPAVEKLLTEGKTEDADRLIMRCQGLLDQAAVLDVKGEVTQHVEWGDYDLARSYLDCIIRERAISIPHDQFEDRIEHVPEKYKPGLKALFDKLISQKYGTKEYRKTLAELKHLLERAER